MIDADVVQPSRCLVNLERRRGPGKTDHGDALSVEHVVLSKRDELGEWGEADYQGFPSMELVGLEPTTSCMSWLMRADCGDLGAITLDQTIAAKLQFRNFGAKPLVRHDGGCSA